MSKSKTGPHFHFWPEVILSILALLAVLLFPSRYYADLSEAGDMLVVWALAIVMVIFVFGTAALWRVIRSSFRKNGHYL